MILFLYKIHFRALPINTFIRIVNIICLDVPEYCVQVKQILKYVKT